MRPQEDLPLIDLSCWNLTIPVNAETIPTKKLLAGYQSPFFQRQVNGALSFIAPSTGENIKPTKNSTYPRAELREVNRDGTLAWWKPWEDVHTLYADLQIDSLGSGKKGIFGQFHPKGTNVSVKLNLTNGTLYMHLRRKYTPDHIKDGDPNYPEDKIAILKGYKLGTRFTYEIKLNERMQLNVWINGAWVLTDYQFDIESYRSAFDGEGDRWYAKAGVYSQTKVGKPGEGRATFYALTITHTASTETPAPTPPALPTTPPVTTTPEVPPAPPKPVKPTLAEQIASVFDAWAAGTMAPYDALLAMNAYSKQVASIPTSKERAPLYAQINDCKDRISGSKK
jgi:hypothetical protein